MIAQLGEVTLAEIAKDFNRRFSASCANLP
ncbi:hypothetical protein AA0229_2008 [Gluconobacter cerinus NRIC 0229]|nr:hypothetical protein AA0229_2008 [Gluconobacter cerinus NRIC 0229]